MWSLSTLRRLNDEAVERSRRQRKQPLAVSLEEVDNFPPFPFPYVGDREVPGWERTAAEWFVDSTGCGYDYEPALTSEQFKAALRAYVAENPGHGFAVVEQGPFQLYVAAFKRA